MKLFDELSEDNFMLYAMQQYYKPNCIDAEEFYNDMKRFMYLKRLFFRYANGATVPERLILNHLIVLFNVFDVQPTLRMLEYQIEDKYWLCQATSPCPEKFILHHGLRRIIWALKRFCKQVSYNHICCLIIFE